MPKRIEVTLTKNGKIVIPKDKRDFFPEDYEDFMINDEEVHVVPPHDEPHIHLGKIEWFKAHPELKEGHRLVIQILERENRREYYLRKLEE